MVDCKHIQIGSLIKIKWEELNIDMERTINFFKCDEYEIIDMFQQHTLSTDSVLKWCKLLEYDFFRLYSQHLILYSPPSARTKQKAIFSQLPVFRKNLYTYEIIEFVIDLLETGEKSRKRIIDEYKIPKTTLYKWIAKYGTKSEINQ